MCALWQLACSLSPHAFSCTEILLSSYPRWSCLALLKISLLDKIAPGISTDCAEAGLGRCVHDVR